jgi:chaperone modulatory protein CbpM
MIELSVRHISFGEFIVSVGVSDELVMELVQCGVVFPLEGDRPEEWLFKVDAVHMAKKAVRIHRDLAIDWADIALVLNLLEEMDQLRAENDQLKQRLQRFLPDSL